MASSSFGGIGRLLPISTALPDEPPADGVSGPTYSTPAEEKKLCSTG